MNDDMELTQKLMAALSDTAQALAYPAADLENLPAHAERVYAQWSSYRELGVAGVRRSGHPSFDPPGAAIDPDLLFIADVAELLGRGADGEYNTDVLLKDLHHHVGASGVRSELSKIHYPSGAACSVCDVWPHYGEGVNNPECTHHRRECHACKRGLWPCETAKIMEIDGWHDADVLDEPFDDAELSDLSKRAIEVIRAGGAEPITDADLDAPEMGSDELRRVIRLRVVGQGGPNPLLTFTDSATGEHLLPGMTVVNEVAPAKVGDVLVDLTFTMRAGSPMDLAQTRAAVAAEREAVISELERVAAFAEERARAWQAAAEAVLRAHGLDRTLP